MKDTYPTCARRSTTEESARTIGTSPEKPPLPKFQKMLAVRRNAMRRPNARTRRLPVRRGRRKRPLGTPTRGAHPLPCPTTPRFTCFCQKHLVPLPALPGRYEGTTLLSCVPRPILPRCPCAGAAGNGRLAPLHEVHGPLFHREPLTICTFRGAGAPYFWNKSPHVLLQPSIVRIDGAPR